MRTLKLIISSSFIILMIACNSSSNSKKKNEGSQDQKATDIQMVGDKTAEIVNVVDSIHNDVNEESEILDKLIRDKVGDAAKAKALPIYTQDSLSAIIAICNYKIEKSARLKFQKSAKEKSYFSMRGSNDSIKVTLNHIDNLIINISSSILVKNKEVERIGFNFDENNNCISRFQWSLEKKYSYYDVIYNDTVIRYDINNRFFPLSSDQKQQIILSTKSSLDSIMEHFPKFKYSFNWK